MFRSRMVVDDHLPVGEFIRLHQVLLDLQSGLALDATFTTVDGNMELKIEWRTVTQDTRFWGRIPSFDYPELAHDPLKLRDGIYRQLSFQFALETYALARPTAQLFSLLELLRSLKNESTLSGSQPPVRTE